jgi:hypothetical protein
MAGPSAESDRTPAHLRAAIWGVGIAQTYTWGVLYYPFSVTGRLIAGDVGVSLELAFIGFSVLLVTGALASPWAGRAIDRFGGRIVLTSGCLVAAGSIAFAALAGGPVAFFASCVALGASSAMVLYDAGFAALVQIAGPHGRRAITYVTFLGGFASTIFWPITAWLCGMWGWRSTYLLYAAGMVVMCAPIYFATLRRPASVAAAEAPAAATASEPDQPLEGEARRFAFIAFASAIAAHQFVIAGLLMHMISAMQQAGLGPEQAIMVGMAFGPGQVFGRVAEMFWGARFPAIAGGRVAVFALPVALAFLLSGSMNFALALLFALGCGMSNGLMTIARGTVALALFGRLGYGAIMGDLGLASLFSRAGGPVALAWGLEHLGLRGSALGCLVFALLACIAMEAVAGADRRRRQAKTAPAG